jgi:hypothetical protein
MALAFKLSSPPTLMSDEHEAAVVVPSLLHSHYTAFPLVLTMVSGSSLRLVLTQPPPVSVPSAWLRFAQQAASLTAGLRGLRCVPRLAYLAWWTVALDQQQGGPDNEVTPW